MTYETPQALRTALEHRLLARSTETKIGLDRLRRRVLFERVIARLQAAEPGQWVLKGGMALEVRLHDDARLTKDVDLGLRDEVAGSGDLHERLINALTANPDGDDFVLAVEEPSPLQEDGSGHLTWRVKVEAQLAGKLFGRIQLDVSPRAHELDATDRIALPNSLDFAGVPATVIEVVDIHRHAAEKLHAICRDYGERENSRVRDLVDVVILIEHDMLTATTVAAATRQVWAERDPVDPPTRVPPLPDSWHNRYEQIAVDHGMDTRSFPAAVTHLDRLWAAMFPDDKEA